MRLVASLLMLLASCTAGGDEIGPTRARSTSTSTTTTTTTTTLARAPRVDRLVVTPLPARQLVGIDLHASEWPGRALDPVLRVGGQTHTRYEYPAPGVLRFLVAEGDALPTGAEVTIQYGDDARSFAVAGRLP